eukprot:jgi/Astpho2/9414/Aster-01676
MNNCRKQQEDREREKEKFEKLRKEREEDAARNGFKQFAKSTTDVLDAALSAQTVGLVTQEQYKRKLAQLQQEGVPTEAPKSKAAPAAKKPKKEKVKARMSFMDDEQEDEEEAAAGRVQKQSGAEPGQPRSLLGKDPTTATDFLPDRERQKKEEELRRQLEEEFKLRQQLIRNEPLQITYSYWDGTGHRKKIVVRKGDTVGEFLKAVKMQLAEEFRDIRVTSVSNMMYVKEDLVLPHNISFYDLILTKARGKTGPLFNFDVHEELRANADTRVESDDSHAGKVVDRHWYDRNKHIFPANRWEVYDADA